MNWRDIQEAERRRDADGRRHLNRHHMHDMALRQEREGVFKQTRLRAAGIVSKPRVPIQDRVTNKVANRLGINRKTRTSRMIRIEPVPTKGNDARATIALFGDTWQKIAQIRLLTK